MPETGFWWILLSIALYGALHSLLASNRIKYGVKRRVGEAVYARFYRLFFAITGGLTFLPTLALAARLPDRAIYTIPAPWVVMTALIQGAALAGVVIGILQTGALAFVGLAQLFAANPQPDAPDTQHLVVSGLYRWVRHPLYTCSILLLWLTPTLTWNILALNIGVTAYFWIGSIFEERKLVEQFGKEYEDYRHHTPRMLPLVRR